MLTTDERDVLQKARDLIADPARWCQGKLALTSDYQSVWPQDSRAARFCARGALMRASKRDCYWFADGTDSLNRADAALNNVAQRLFPDVMDSTDEWGARNDPIVAVNNILGHEAVLAAFDKLLADESVA